MPEQPKQRNPHRDPQFCAIFKALAHPTRRRMLDYLQDHQRVTANELAQWGCAIVTKPAITKHLKLLRRAELVEVSGAGRHHYYSLRAEPMHLVAEWLYRYTYKRGEMPGHFPKEWSLRPHRDPRTRLW